MAAREKGDFAAKALMHAILAAFGLVCILPMVVTITISLSDEKDLVLNGYSLFPRIFSTASYAFILRNPAALLNSYKVTIVTTCAGTFLGVLAMSMAAFALARPDFRIRRFISFYVFFTMLFSGGLVPTYMIMTRTLHLQDSLWVLFLPVMVNAWNTFLMTAYLKSIPFELIESAEMDGASELRIYAQITLPMATPAVATVALLVSLRLWNEWFSSLLYIRNQRMISLQFWMQRVMQNMQFLLLNQDMMGGNVAASMDNFPTESVRMAMAVLAAGPMLFIFPFFQRYFVKGLQVGAIKG